MNHLITRIINSKDLHFSLTIQNIEGDYLEKRYDYVEENGFLGEKLHVTPIEWKLKDGKP